MSCLPAVFEFESRAVRSVAIGDMPWFVATDVAAILGYRDAADLNRNLDADEKGTHSVRTLGGQQTVTIISEPGLYRAIIQRRATAAIPAETRDAIARFQRWVFHDLLPAIRRAGTYAPQADQTERSLRLIAECRRTFGAAAAQGLWSDLGLPRVDLAKQAVKHKAAARKFRLVAPADLTERVGARIRVASTDGIYRRELMRYFDCYGRAVHLDKAIAELTAQRRITTDVHRRAAGGRPSTLYRWAPQPVAH